MCWRADAERRAVLRRDGGGHARTVARAAGIRGARLRPGAVRGAGAGAGQHPGEADPVRDHAAAHDPDARAVLAGAERVDAMAHGQARPRVRRARRRHDAGRVPDPGGGEHAVEDAGAAVIPRDRTGSRPRLIGSIALGFVVSLFAATTAGWL